MNVKIEDSWKSALADEWDKPYFKTLTDFVRAEYMSGQKIYPSPKDIFAAFDLCPLEKTKVVIVGQDPYHNPGQAHGLCFSVPENTMPPPSLINIYKEMESDLGRPSKTRGDLTEWAKQGVLLLNSTLTVRAFAAASHANKGWEKFTDAVIKTLSAKKGLAYILWGSYAQQKCAFINADENLILKSAHPSPLSASRGFFGNRHFSKTNEYLISHNQTPIDW
ncbi:MAG: uracil-DNA glycosylase [Rickettsiales bacterium]|jgi:uracil-DNA glycosylase|nr:uracil-DNA glycosylase [Rickettsiales bacterium]